MKNSTSLLLFAAGTILTGVLAGTANAAEETDTTRPPRHARGPMPLPPEIMSIYDVDANGVLDEDERAVLHEDVASGEVTLPRGGPRGRGPGGPPPEIVAQYDADKNGKLDDTERAALRADVEAGKVTLPEPRGPRGRGEGRRMGPPPELVAQYDADGNGTLDETEHAALRADIASGKVQPPRRGMGRGGPPPAADASDESSDK